MKNFRTYQIALSFYQECKKLKISNRNIRDQFERASLSIVLNLAEGAGRATSKERKRFYVIAFGSLRETQCLLKIMNQERLYRKSDSVAACLYRLIQNPGCLNA